MLPALVRTQCPAHCSLVLSDSSLARDTLQGTNTHPGLPPEKQTEWWKSGIAEATYFSKACDMI